MECQLEELPKAGEKLDEAELTLIKSVRVARRLVDRVVRLPVVVLGRTPKPARPPPGTVAPPRRPPLALQVGEKARVRSVDDIRGTLDEHGRCAGLSYVPVMDRFAGQSFTVRKRIDRFFDERTRTMLKVRDVVILDNVFCEAQLTSDVDYGGCTRTCFLFWKEDWLDRVDTGR